MSSEKTIATLVEWCADALVEDLYDVASPNEHSAVYGIKDVRKVGGFKIEVTVSWDEEQS